MLILILIIGIVLFVTGREEVEETLEGFGFIAICLSVFMILVLLIAFPYNIDEKIELYETENMAIETKIKETVRAYMNYEQETYTNLVENADLVTLLITYPELNSNELVKSEIDIYKDNSSKLKELKEEQLMKPTLAWWLYFGR